jgi:hypothetical protein
MKTWHWLLLGGAAVWLFWPKKAAAEPPKAPSSVDLTKAAQALLDPVKVKQETTKKAETSLSQPVEVEDAWSSTYADTEVPDDPSFETSSADDEGLFTEITGHRVEGQP